MGKLKIEFGTFIKCPSKFNKPWVPLGPIRHEGVLWMSTKTQFCRMISWIVQVQLALSKRRPSSKKCLVHSASMSPLIQFVRDPNYGLHLPTRTFRIRALSSACLKLWLKSAFPAFSSPWCKCVIHSHEQRLHWIKCYCPKSTPKSKNHAWTLLSRGLWQKICRTSC